ncbi:hypothetical protein HZA86_03045 [Candidatus Uhrbacteria bacterium]|nr:hypothetical protein [Candidatus Uhrbacteria bacterium]
MFGISKLLGVLGAMIVVPTVAYVLGETTAEVGSNTLPQPPAVVQDQQNPKQPPQERPGPGNRPNQEGGGFFQPGPGMMGGPTMGQPGGQGNGQGFPEMRDPRGTGPQGDPSGNNWMQGLQKMMGGDGGSNTGIGSGQAPGDRGRENQGFQGMMQQGAPDDGQWQKRQEEEEQRQKEREKKMLEQIKKSLSQKATKPLAMLKAKIAAVERKGITVPEDTKTFVSEFEQAMQQVKSAETMEDAEDALMTLQESRQEFEENFQTLQEIGNWKKILAQAKVALKREQTTLAKAMRQSKRAGAFDMADELTKLSDAVVALQSTLNKAQELSSNGKVEEAVALLHEDFFGTLEDLDDVHRTVDTLSNLSQGLRRAPAEIKQIKSRVAALKRKKVDTSEADQKLVELNAKHAQIQTLAKAKPVDSDGLVEAVQEGSQLLEEMYGILDDLQGTQSETDKLFGVNGATAPTLDLDFGLGTQP